MIHQVLTILIDDLKHYFQRKNREEQTISLNHPNRIPTAFSGVGVTLLNLQKDGLHLNANSGLHTGASSSFLCKAQVLFTFYHHEHGAALQSLDTLFTYFEDRPVFSPENTVNFPEVVQKITCEPQDLTWNDLSQIWSLFPGKHVPSLVYELRIIANRGETVLDSLILKEVSTETD